MFRGEEKKKKKGKELITSLFNNFFQLSLPFQKSTNYWVETTLNQNL